MYRVAADDASFRDGLDRLKQNGSALLVVGDVPDECYAEASHRMLGDTDHAARRRVVVVDEDTPPGLANRLSAPTASANGSLHLISHDSTARNAVESAPTVTSDARTTHVPADDLESVGEAVLSAIDEGETGTFDPAELRLGVDTVGTLLDAGDEFPVFRLVDFLARRVRTLGGMAHFRLARSRDAYHTRLLEPLFDAVVELRLNGGMVEQRWELLADDIHSEWIPLDA